jgi:hypothetical protein
MNGNSHKPSRQSGLATELTNLILMDWKECGRLGQGPAIRGGEGIMKRRGSAAAAGVEKGE